MQQISCLQKCDTKCMYINKINFNEIEYKNPSSRHISSKSSEWAYILWLQKYVIIVYFKKKLQYGINRFPFKIRVN